MDRTFVVLDRDEYESLMKLNAEPLRGLVVEDVTSGTYSKATIYSFAISYGSCANQSIDFTFKDIGDVTVTFGPDTDTRAEVIADLNAQLDGYTASEYDVDGIQIQADVSGVDRGFLDYPTSGYFAMVWDGVVVGSGLPSVKVTGEMYVLTDGVYANHVAMTRENYVTKYFPPVVGSFVFNKNTGQRLDFDGTSWHPHGRKKVRVYDNTTPNGPRRFQQVPMWTDEGNIIKYSVTCLVGVHNIPIKDEFFAVDSFEFYIQIDPGIDGIRFYRTGETIGWDLPNDVTGNLFTMYHVMISGGQMSITGMTTSSDWT